MAAPAAAQNATWAGPGADWNTNANWSPAVVPTDTATFGNPGPKTVTFSSAATGIGTMQFGPLTPTYNFSLNAQTLTISGSGIIVADALSTPTITPFDASVIFQNASTAGNTRFNLFQSALTFQNSSNAGSATIAMLNDFLPGAVTFKNTASAADATIGNNVGITILGGGIFFMDASTAGNATIVNNPSIAIAGEGGRLIFGDPLFVGTHTSNAGTSHITNNQFGTTSFLSQTSAASATIVNNNGGSTNFQESATAANAKITNNAGGFLLFGDQATAGNATIINNGTMTFGFNFGFGDTATAGNATITTNNGGTISFYDSTSGGTARFITNAGGMFDMSGLSASGMTAGSIEGAGSYILGSKELVVGGNNLSTEVIGVISGAGGKLTKVGAGTLILSGTNTYTGGTFNCACSTLQLGTLARVGTILGAVTNEGVFNIVNANTAGITSITNKLGGETHFFNATSASSATIVNNNGFTAFHDTSSAASADITNRNGGETTFLNNATAANATITNRDLSATNFLNTSTASHAAIVNNGGVTYFLDQSTAANADLTNRNGGATIFGTLGGTDTATAGNATITNRPTGGETIFYAMTTAGAASIVNNGGATFFFDQSTAGNADLTNRNGGATIFGTLGGTDTATAGNATITNRPTGGETFFFALTTAGAASIVNNGGMTSFFDNSNAGTANITNKNGGLTLFGDNASAAGATIDNRDGCFCSPSLTVFTGTSNAGTATITNTNFGAVLFVDGATAANANIVNNADGATVFGTSGFTDAPTAGNATITNNGGGITLFQAFSTSGNAKIITNNGGATGFFDNSTGGNAQFITNAGGIVDFSQTTGPAGDGKISAGSIAGAGDHYLGGNQLTVGGNNLSTEVNGTINDGASPLSCGCGPGGTGASIVKIGGGTLTLSGVNTYTGPTTVDAGKLVVNGSIVSSSGLIVNAGGTIGGNGMLPKTTINGGTLSPGNSIGTITINNNLTFVGAGNYIVEVSPANADLTKVIGSPGSAAVAGTLSAIGTGGVYTIGTKYTVLNTAGGVSGTFGNIAIGGSFGATKPHIEYDANNVYLVLGPNAISPSLAGGTFNQRAAAGAVDAALQAGNQLAPFNALFNVAAAQLPAALDALSGEVHASTAGVLVDESLYLRSAVLGRLRQASYGGDAAMAALSTGGPQLASADNALTTLLAYGGNSSLPVKAPLTAPAASRDIAFWAQGFGAWGKFDGDGNAATVRRDLAGFFTGVDARFGDWRGGIAAGYTSSRNNLDGRGSANVETGHAAAYAGWSFGALKVRAGGAYAWHTIDTSRAVALPGFFDTPAAHYNGGTGQVFGEAGYGIALGKMALEPFAGAAWVHLATDAFNERGGAAALRAAANSFEVGYSTLGIRAASVIPLWWDMVLVPRVSAAWQHALSDVTPTATLAFQGAGAPFLIAGVPIARDSLLSEAGLDLAISRHATFGLSYVGQLARNAQDHAAKGKFIWSF